MINSKIQELVICTWISYDAAGGLLGT